MKSRLLTGCSFLMFGVAMAYGFITLTGLMVASSEWSGIAVLAETATLLLCALAAVSSFLMWKRLNAGWWITLASASLLAVWHGVSVARTALILRRMAGEGDDRLYYVREKMLSECLYYLIPRSPSSCSCYGCGASSTAARNRSLKPRICSESGLESRARQILSVLLCHRTVEHGECL